MEREEEKGRKESRCLSQRMQQKNNGIISPQTLEEAPAHSGVHTIRFTAQPGTVLVRSLI